MKKPVALIFIGFTLGILFVVSSLFLYKKVKPLIKKVADKIEERIIENIPKVKKPLIISTFENNEELASWESINAVFQLSRENASSGSFSGKITFKPGKGPSSIKLEKYITTHKALSDWSRYEVLSFDIFNQYASKERMIVQIKDKENNTAKINLYLEPNKHNRILINVRDLWDDLNPRSIAQLTLFLWDNPAEKVFFVDDMLLAPQNLEKKLRTTILSSEYIPKEGEKIYAGEDYFEPEGAFEQIPFTLLSPVAVQSASLPSCGGVPFGKGQLQSLQSITVVDQNNQILPSQARITARWPDQSIKWIVLDLMTTGAADSVYYLKKTEKDKAINEQDTRWVIDSPAEIKVDTGALQFSVKKNRFFLFDKIWLQKDDDKEYTDEEIEAEKVDMMVSNGPQSFYASLDEAPEVLVEEQGPLKVCIKAKGWFVSSKKEKFCQFITRIYAFKGQSYLKIQHTFIYTGYPENKYHYLYQGKRLPRNETMSAVSIHMPFKQGFLETATFAADEKVMQTPINNSISFLQSNSDVFSVSKGGNQISAGKRLEGWIDLGNQTEGVCIGVKDFWQQYPKGFDISKDKGTLSIQLWPEEAGPLDFKTTELAYGPEAVARGSAFGVGKTHEINIYFHQSDYQNTPAKQVIHSLCAESYLRVSPQWIAQTKVLGRLLPYEKRLAPAEEFLSRMFDWGDRQIDQFRWYGMLDFGDTLSWYRMEAYDKSYDDWGWHPEGRWGWLNCEIAGTHAGALLQYARTGEKKYFDFAAHLARHIMDIDTCHFNTVRFDKRLTKVIPDDYSRVGSMHRHNGNHWGGRNEEAAHTNVLGLAYYYYITGDMRAKDVIEEIGDFFLSERITYFRHPDIAPQRTIANVLWGDVVLFELTNNEKFKRAADKWADFFYAGQSQDGSWPENYNPVKKRWEGKAALNYIVGYTVPALIAYHQLTGNKAIAESICKATDFIIKTEQYAAYFDCLAYSYWLTRDKKYLENTKERVDFTVSHQKRSDDPIWDGMIYQKAYYVRPVEYLYKMPFALSLLFDFEKEK